MPPPTITTLACCGNEEAMVYESDTVVGLVNSLGLFARVAPVPSAFGEAIGIQALDVIRWLGFQQRLYEQMSNSRGPGDSVGIAAASHHKTLDSTALADNESP